MARDLARVRVRADDESKGAFDSFKRNIAESLTGVNGLGVGINRLQGFVAALGFTLSVGGLGLLASQAINAHAALDDLSETTSLTVETLSSLERVAYVGGRSLESVQPIATRFAKNVAEAAGGNRELIRTFEGMGISLERLKSGKFDDIYLEFARKIATAENRQLAIAYATELAGKSAATAIPHFRDLAEEGLRQGRVTATQAAEAEALQKSWRRLIYDAGGLKNALVADVVPGLTRVVGLLAEARRLSGGFVGGIGQVLGIALSPGDIAAQLKDVNAKLESPDLVSRAKDALGLGDQDREALQRRRQLLLWAQRQQALALGGAGSLDANDLRMAAGARGAYLDPNAIATVPKGPQGDSPYHSLAKGLATRAAELEREVNYKEKLTALDKLQIDLNNMKPEQLARLAAGERAMLEIMALHVDELTGSIRARENDTKASEAWIEAALRASKAQEEWDRVLGDFKTTHSETRQQLEFETKLLGMQHVALGDVFMSQEQLRKLQLDYDVERETSVALRKLELDFIKKTAGATVEQYDALKKLYDLERERLPEAVRKNREAQFALDVGRQIRDQAKATADDINRSITDGLMRGFESGKDIAGNFFDTLKNMAKTVVIRPVIQFLVAPVGNAVSMALGSLGIPGLGGGSGGGGAGGLLNAASGLNNISGLFGGGALFGGGSVGSLGSAGVMTAAPVFEGGAMIAGAEFASLGSAAGASSFASAAIPYVGLALAAAGALGLFGGSKKTPATGTGYQFSGAYGRGSGLDLSLLGHFTNPGLGTHYMPPGQHIVPLTMQIETALGEMEKLAKSLGATGDSGGFRAAFDFTSSRIGQAGEADAYAAVVRQVTGQFAEHLIPGLREMAQANEDLIDTFARLATARREADLNAIFARMQGVLNVSDQLADLWLSDLSPLTATQRLTRSRSEYESLLAGARGGDLQSISGLSAAARAYVEEAKSFYGGTASLPYGSIFGGVQTSIQDLVSETLTEQSMKFSEMGLTLQSIDGRLDGLDKRIAAALQPAIDAMTAAQAAAAKAAKDAADRIVQAQQDAAREQALVSASVASAALVESGARRGRAPSQD